MSGTSPFNPAFLGRLGPWRVLRRLGRGGAAVVYEVLHPESGQRAALKLLNDPDVPDRVVQREYRALALLDHPGIVRVFGCGRLPDGPSWLLMELVVGTTSQASAQLAGLRGSPARAARAERIAHDLVDALAYLHHRRIIHRDVKSSNVLATTEGGIKLLDLGAAGYAPATGGAGPVRVPGSGAFAGTVVYASPEQLRGAALDARSDLFSVGVLWYRMLTGALPFVATDLDAALAARAAGPPMARLRRVAGVAAEVSELIGALLEPQPQHRPSKAAAVLQRIRPMPSEEPGCATALWSEPPPLCGRAGVLEALDDFVAASPAARLAVLEADAGQPDGPLLPWIVASVRRGGGVAVGVNLADSQGGGLLTRLLLALPRHLRRGAGVPASARQAAAGALARLASGRTAPVILTVDGLDLATEADLADLEAVLATGAALGRDLKAVGLWRVESQGAAPRWPTGTLRVPLPPMDPVATLRHVRSLSAQRVLPFSLESALLHQGSPTGLGVGGWAREQVAGGRLVLGATPEGVPVWMEGPAGADEGPMAAGSSLGAHLADAPGAVPWEGPAEGGGMAHFSGLLAVEPEEAPEPSVRAVLFAWRGLARQVAGDHDLQAEADLLRADEELRGALSEGWEGAQAWRLRVALARVAGLLARGRIRQAKRLLVSLDVAGVEPGWPPHPEALQVALARSAGEAVPEEAGLAAAAELALAWLQAGRLREVARCVQGAGESAPGGWGAAERVALAVASAGAARLQGELAAARTLLLRALSIAEVEAPGPPRARLHLALADLDIDLFRPGLCREHLADAWVLLRQCDRPETSAERARVLARAALLRGEPGQAEAAARGGLELLRGTGLEVIKATLGCWLARALGRQGRRAEARVELASARARIEAAGARPALALACLVAWELAGSREDPAAFRAPVEAWLRSQRARLIRFEWQLAALRHAEAMGDSARRASLRRRTRELLRTLQRDLPPEDRGVMEQSPALRVVLRVR